MRIVGDDSHEMTILIFSEKIIIKIVVVVKIRMSSAANFAWRFKAQRGI